MKISEGASAAAAAVAVALLVWWIATPRGLGISPDSTQYLSAAHNLASGRGLVVHWWARGVVPLTHFPPLFPVAMAALTRLGLPVAHGAAVINACSFVVCVVLTFVLARRSGLSDFVALCTSLAVALARDVQEVHAMVWSEPLYMALTMGALYLTVIALRDDRWSSLFLVAVCAALSVLTRYAGLALVGSSGLCLLLFAQGSWQRRLQRAAAFGGIAMLPVGLAFLRNLAQAESLANREIAFHPLSLARLRPAASTVYHWLTPRTLDFVELPVLLAVGGGILLYALVWVRAARAKPVTFTTSALDVLPVLVAYGVCYVAFLALSISIADAQTPLNPRLLAPLIPPFAVVAANVLAASARNVVLRRATAVLLVVVGVGLLTALVDWARPARREGLGYNSARWNRSELAKAVGMLPRNVDVYSNYPDALLYLTGREAIGLPRIFSPTSLKPNRQYEREFRSICADAGNRRVAIAYFLKVPPEKFIPSIAQIRRRLASRPVTVVDDGVVDTVPPSCPRTTAGDDTLTSRP